MRNILLFLLFFVFLSDISAQTRAGLLNITSFPTALSGNRFRITNATFNDPTGESTASNVTESWVLWKSNHRFTVDTIENVFGSLITLVVNDVDLVGFLSTGIANLGSVNTDGTINVAPTGDSNSSYMTPSDNASLNRYNLNKTATQTLGSTIVNSINNQLGSNGWQSGIQLDTIIQSLHGFSVSTRKFYPVRVDNTDTWYNTSASAEMFFPSAYVVDSLNANTFVVQYSGRLLISGGHGYTVGSKLYLDNTGNPNTTAGTKKLLLATVPNDSVLILQPVPIESGTTQTGSQIVSAINTELGSTDWQTGGSSADSTLNVLIPETIETSTVTATLNKTILVDTSSSAITINPPTGFSVNDFFRVCDVTCNALTNNVTIDFVTASQKMSGSIQNYYLNSDCGCAEFQYVGSTTGWQPINK